MGQTQSRNGETRTELSIIANDDDEPGIRGLRSSNINHHHHIRASTFSKTSSSYSKLSPGAASQSTSISRPADPELDPLQDALIQNSPKANSFGSAAHGAAGVATGARAQGSPETVSTDPNSIASTLDSCLGRKSSLFLSKSQAMGTVTSHPGGAAAETLKEVSPRSTPQMIPKRTDQIRNGTHANSQGNSIGSSQTGSSLTSQSVSSSDSPLTSPDMSDEDPVYSPSGVAARHVKAAKAVAPASSAAGLPINRYIKRICVSGLQNQKTFCMTLDEIKGVCRAASELFLSQPVLLELATPVKVVGDTHGQFKDLMRIFRMSGMPPNTNYLFLGDYVDRGKQSLETIMLLLCLKLRFPSNVFLLRGNHESANVTKVYGFYDECKRRSSLKAWRMIVDVFNTLPVAATIGSKIFCVHGGLSPNLTSLQDIERISRPTDVPDSGLMSDMLWSDPDPQVKEWTDNDRGVSYCFGKRVLDRFCSDFKFDLVARGHMVVEDGYEFFGNRKLVTIFSAPNYCGDFDNWGAVMSVDENLLCSFELLQPGKKSSKKSP